MLDGRIIASLSKNFGFLGFTDGPAKKQHFGSINRLLKLLAT